MDLCDFSENGGHAYVVGLAFCFPPRYACLSPSGWMWTSELTEAETFATREQAEAHMRGGMDELVDGNEDVKVMEVEMKVGEA